MCTFYSTTFITLLELLCKSRFYIQNKWSVNKIWWIVQISSSCNNIQILHVRNNNPIISYNILHISPVLINRFMTWSLLLLFETIISFSFPPEETNIHCDNLSVLKLLQSDLPIPLIRQDFIRCTTRFKHVKVPGTAVNFRPGEQREAALLD